jgi:uncharacterized coiled-coil protein SlyX
MRRVLGVVTGVLVVVLFLGTIVLWQTYRKTAESLTSMKTQDESMEARYGEAINQIASIQDSLNAIDLGDQSVHLTSTQLDAERQLSNNKGDEAMARIADLKASIERTRARIHQLENSLHVSGIKVAGLEKMIAGLKSNVAEKETQITQLTARVDSLQTQVAGLSTEVEVSNDKITAQAQNIEDKRRELGTVYCAIGSKKDLTTAGLVVAKGGVLGIGKTLEPSGVVNDSAFTSIDTDQQTVIQIPAAKAQVLSAQPVASYQLQLVDGKMELHITDPKEFRKIKHLVIMTA